MHGFAPLLSLLASIELKLIHIRHKPWEPIDAVRRARVKLLCLAYLCFTVVAGIALYGVMSIEPRVLSAPTFGHWLPGIRTLASQSFYPAYIETFLSIMVAAAWIMGVLSWFWIPGGSEVAYGSLMSKVLLLCCALLIIAGLIFILFTDNSYNEIDDARSSAMLALGASSVFGAVTVLNIFFGFGHLFFIAALKAVATAHIDDSEGI